MKHTCENCQRWKQEPGSIFGNLNGTCERAATVEVAFRGDCIRAGQPYEVVGDNPFTAERIAKPMVHINAVSTYGQFGCIHWLKKPRPSLWRRLIAYLKNLRASAPLRPITTTP